MFVARALTTIGPMAGSKSASQSVALLTTATVEGWVEDPARPVQISGGTGFVMPADAMVRIVASMSTSNTFESWLLLNGTQIASKGAESNPTITADNVEVREGDIVTVNLRNSAYVTRTIHSGTLTITPV